MTGRSDSCGGGDCGGVDGDGEGDCEGGKAGGCEHGGGGCGCGFLICFETSFRGSGRSRAALAGTDNLNDGELDLGGMHLTRQRAPSLVPQDGAASIDG